MLYLITIIGLVWTCLALETIPFYGGLFETLRLSYISIVVSFWVASYILVVQFFYIRFIYKDKLLKKYALYIQKDLVVSGTVATLLALLYWSDGISYDFKGIDLAFAGIPFGIASIYTLYQLLSIRFAGEKLRKKPIYIMLFSVILIYFGIFYSLFDNLQGQYSSIKASWMQINIVSFSFVLYMTTHLIEIYMKEGKVSIPAFQKLILEGMSNNDGELLSQIEEPIEKLNKNLLQKKAVHSANLRNKNKNKKTIKNE